MRFHEKLYSLRKAANMTQSDLAEKLNVSRQAVSRWEMGTAMPDVENLIVLSDLFSVTLDDLLKNKEDAPEEEIPGPEGKKPRYRDFLPKKWWVLPVIAAGLKVISYVRELFYLLIPQSYSGTTTAVDLDSFSAFLMMVFSIPVMNLLSAILLGLTACCFLWALVRWLKAK